MRMGVAVGIERSLAVETVVFHHTGSFSHLSCMYPKVRGAFQTSCTIIMMQAILTAHFAWRSVVAAQGGCGFGAELFAVFPSTIW